MPVQGCTLAFDYVLSQDLPVGANHCTHKFMLALPLLSFFLYLFSSLRVSPVSTVTTTGQNPGVVDRFPSGALKQLLCPHIHHYTRWLSWTVVAVGLSGRSVTLMPYECLELDLLMRGPNYRNVSLYLPPPPSTRVVLVP